MNTPNQPRLYSAAFIAMAGANFAAAASFGVFFLFPLVIEKHGGTKTDIGLIMGIFALSATLCRPWVSQLIDRLGRKHSYTIGSLLMTLLPCGYMILSNDLEAAYLPLLGLRIVHGIGLALCFTACFTYLADIVPPARLNEGIGMFGISGLVGLAVGPVLAELALDRWSEPAFFLTASGLAAIGLVCHLPLAETLVRGREGDRISFLTVLLQRKMLLVAILAVLFGFGLAGSGNFVAPLAAERHIAFVSLYFLCYSAAAVLVRLVGGRLADRIGERRILPYALTITGAGLLALPLVQGHLGLAAAGLASGCGHGLLYPALNSWAIRNEPAAVRGKVTGIYTGALDAGNFSGSLMLGLVGEWWGLSALFVVAGGALLVGLLVLRWSSRAAY
jgi:predicted MFS family arabinose efflux permease